MHNHNDKYPFRPGFEPGTPRLQAPVDTNLPLNRVADISFHIQGDQIIIIIKCYDLLP